MVVFLNPHCSYERGVKRWKRVAGELSSLTGAFHVEANWSEDNLAACVDHHVRSGRTLLVAAGGDGTVNLLTNAIMSVSGSSHAVTLGAIGLGSSNDYHKSPYRRSLVHGIPVKVNRESVIDRDVIEICYLEAANQWRTRYCLNNASLGVTAEANDLFNNRPGFIRRLRQLSVNAAIAATAVRTIASYRNLVCRVTCDGSDAEDCLITNLGVVKNPHFAGSFCYEPTVQPDDGWLAVHVCENMTRPQAISILWNLARGRFHGCPGTRTTCTKWVSVESQEPFAVEFDGEVIRTDSVRFSVLRRALRCCQ